MVKQIEFRLIFIFMIVFFANASNCTSQIIDTVKLGSQMMAYSVVGQANSWFEWKVDGGVVYEDNRSSSVYINWGMQEGIYALKVVEHTAGGCYGDTIKAFVLLEKNERKLTIQASNVFTPNDDGANDVFKISFNQHPEEYSLKIWSRWGILVYNSNDINQSWAGKTSGQCLTPGIYFWSVSCRFAGTEYYKNGFVELLR